jgi:hypothetical protein
MDRQPGRRVAWGCERLTFCWWETEGVISGSEMEPEMRDGQRRGGRTRGRERGALLSRVRRVLFVPHQDGKAKRSSTPRTGIYSSSFSYQSISLSRTGPSLPSQAAAYPLNLAIFGFTALLPLPRRISTSSDADRPVTTALASQNN